jgi:hypothetical protein
MKKIKEKGKKGRVHFDKKVIAFPGSKMFGSKKEKFLNKRADDLAQFWYNYFENDDFRKIKRTWKYMNKRVVKGSESVPDIIHCASSALGFKSFAVTASKICFDGDAEESRAIV